MTSLPAAVRESIEAVRPGRRLSTLSPVSGGCINRGARLGWDDRAEHFLKWNPAAPAGMFAAESDGLTALRHAAEAAGAELVVPRARAWGETADGDWLLLDWVEPARAARGFEARFGAALATLHATAAGDTFGWASDNWIGSLPQPNGPDADWARFWAEKRIDPQLDRARRAGHCTDPVFDRLLDALPAALPGVPAPSLLHGDLWSGNAYAGRDGTAVLVDPAVYRGHAEVDLAMTELFGGFSEAFYDAYAAVRPLDPAYRSHRRDAYQLYYLLVHVNLFGASYEPGARAAAARVVEALG